MLGGAAAGAGILQISPTAVIAVAAILVTFVAAAFITGPPAAGATATRRDPAQLSADRHVAGAR